MTGTQQLDALDKLIEVVQAGQLPDAVVWSGALPARGHWSYDTGINANNRRKIYLAFNGSLDAAKALHKALLHERYVVTIQYSERYLAKVIIRDSVSRSEWLSGEEWIDPARAWLLAILKAYRAQVAQ